MVVVVVIEILSAPDTTSAPTGHPGEVIPRSGDGVTTLMTNAAAGAIGGPILSKIGGKVLSRIGSREGGEVVQQSVGRGARNPKVAEKLAEGRAKHAEFAKKVEAKPGWKSEPSLKDPKTGKTVKPEAVTPSGKSVELKPNTPSGRAQGRRQLPGQERATGKKGRVVYYEPKND